MLPWQSTVASRYPPVVVWALILLCGVAFLFQISLPPRAFERFLLEYGLVPARFFGPFRGPAPGDPLAFLTHMFLHGGWLHLIVNMWTLWLFGAAVEDRLGPVRFLAFYLVCGLAAGFAHAILNATSTVPAVGASGAIAGVMGCYVRFFPRARLVMMVPILFFPFFFEVRAIVFGFVWLIMQVIPGLLQLGQTVDTGGVAWWAHIGGFAAGWLLAPRVRRPRGRYRPYYRDEGAFGFLPDGRRGGGSGPWG